MLHVFYYPGSYTSQITHWTERSELASSDFSSDNSGSRIKQEKKKKTNKSQTKPKLQSIKPNKVTQNLLGL